LQCSKPTVGKDISITSWIEYNYKVTLCGVKVYGYQNEVKESLIPGYASSIDVDSRGLPYVVNDFGAIYRMTDSKKVGEGAWAKVTEAEGLAYEVFTSSGNSPPWKISRPSKAPCFLVTPSRW
jgi:hypothetical protein